MIDITGFSACERGNTMLHNDGSIVAWLTIDHTHRLEVSYSPGNYPSLNVKYVHLSDIEIATHINTQLGGWIVMKNDLRWTLNGFEARILPHDEWGSFDKPQACCPACYDQDNIVNEDGHGYDGTLPITCHTCGYQWHEPEVKDA